MQPGRLGPPGLGLLGEKLSFADLYLVEVEDYRPLD
jgi:hypothetical protein